MTLDDIVLSGDGSAVTDAVTETPEPAEEQISSAADEAKTDAGDSETPETETDETENPKHRKGKGGFQKRIDQLTAEKSAALSRAEELERRLAEKAANPGENQKQTQTKADGKPEATTFDSYEEYVEALTDWKFDQRAKQRAAEEEHQKRGSAWQQQIGEARKRYDDFDEVTGNDDIPVTAAMQEAMITSDAGADLAYYLGSNPAEAARIAKLGPIAAARALGVIEASLKSQSKETTATTISKPVSKAPTPARPIGGKTPTSSKSPEEMDFEEYKAFINKR